MDNLSFNTLLRRSFKAFSIALCFTLINCSDFLEIDPPKSRVAKTEVYDNDITATQAITGIYNTMATSGSFSSGDERSVSLLSALSADEIRKFPRDDASYIAHYEFDKNDLSSRNELVLNLWGSMYKVIYQANDAVEGLKAADKITPELKEQLLAEALFIRAFTYYYLVNLFGKVPLILDTDYTMNSAATRTDVNLIIQTITADLEEAIQRFKVSLDGSRVRANKDAATVLLARVYLSSGAVEQAEQMTSRIIDDSTNYSLVQNLDSVFLAGSKETIFGLMPVNDVNSPSPIKINSLEAQTFIPVFSFMTPNYALTEELLNSFSPNDLRKVRWVSSDFMGTVFYPFKYKVVSSEVVSEYAVVMRLAEVYLIRAEARIRLKKFSEGLDDLDMIRKRAGLDPIRVFNPGIDDEQAYLAIEDERRWELFSEWGHRWLDLKRLGRSGLVLSQQKPGWNSTDVLYPIPATEFEQNPSLGLQNDGY